MPRSDYNYETRIVTSRLNKELQILDSIINSIDGKIVLDAGSGGDKHYYKEFTSRGLKTIRIDINVDNLRSAPTNSGGNNAHLLAGNVNSIPLADESVDIIFMCEILEHLNAPEQALKEAHRVLKKGGYIFIDVPWLHEMYRPLSAITLRNLASFKRNGKPPWLLKIMYKNPGEIDNLKDSAMLKRRWLGSFLINTVRVLPTFRSFDPEYFVYNYYHGSIPEGNMHLQFRYPHEWAEAVRVAGFKMVKKTGAFIAPPPFSHSILCNLVCSKLEHLMQDHILSKLSQILIVVAVKT